MATVIDLEPDALVHMADHLSCYDIVNLSASCRALRAAVRLNETLWTSLYARTYENPWKSMTAGSTRAPQQLSWHDLFLRTHDACHQLVSTHPVIRSWSVDSSAVALVQIHSRGGRRHVLAAQQNILEIKCGAPGNVSFQLYGHNGRVSCADVLELPGDRLGIISGSADQTIRLWQARLPAPPGEDGDEPHPEPGSSSQLTLLTPTRTLRGHTESVTCLQTITGSTGVCIAATGGKERVVKLWGLAPLLPSPVHQPQIATLRGHGAPVTCLAPIPAAQYSSRGGQAAVAGEGGAGSSAAALLSGSLDSRIKLWDVWIPACISTAKLPSPVTLLLGIADPLGLAPSGLAQHAVVAATGNAVLLLDVRSMRATQVTAQPERAEQVLCMAQWGSDVVAGGRDGTARVWDLRMVGGEPRLALRGHTRQVTSVAMDRLKVVTATHEYGETPMGVWSRDSGKSLAKLGSAPPPRQTPGGGTRPREGAQLLAAAGDHGAASGAENSEEEAGSEGEEGARAGWEGVTALACRGAVLVSGNAEGLICERDFSHGSLPGFDGGREEQGGRDGEQNLLGKFWRVDIH